MAPRAFTVSQVPVAMVETTKPGPCRSRVWVGETPRKPAFVIRWGSFGSRRGETVVLVVRVTSRPSRRTTIVASPPPLPRIAFCICSQLVTACPLKDTMRSPGSNPADFAGATGSAGVHLRGAWSAFALVTAITHWETLLTVVVGL